MNNYFTDREYGECHRVIDGIDQRLWAGLHSLIETRIGNHSFGYRFPEQCPDGYGACGCDSQSFGRVLGAEIPFVEWPISHSEPPDTPVILDLLEFCASAVGEPIEESFHSFFRHNHLSWDRESGLVKFVEDVNLLFARNGIAYELTAEGEVRRILPQPLADALSLTQFATGDGETDRSTACSKMPAARSRSLDQRIVKTQSRSFGMRSSVLRRLNLGWTSEQERTLYWIEPPRRGRAFAGCWRKRQQL